jgi:hypothetical protein
MHHTDADDIEAAKKAVVLLDKSIYKDKMGNAGLYFAQLQQREKELSALNTPRLGDSMLDSTGQPWLIAIQKRAPKLDQDKLDQIAALPLGSRLRTDAWDDKVYTLKTTAPVLLNARDKMPFEVTPVYYKLARYDQAQTAAGTEASPTQQPQAQPDQASAQPAAQPQQ